MQSFYSQELLLCYSAAFLHLYRSVRLKVCLFVCLNVCLPVLPGFCFLIYQLLYFHEQFFLVLQILILICKSLIYLSNIYIDINSTLIIKGVGDQLRGHPTHRVHGNRDLHHHLQRLQDLQLELEHAVIYTKQAGLLTAYINLLKVWKDPFKFEKQRKFLISLATSQKISITNSYYLECPHDELVAALKQLIIFILWGKIL